MTSIFVPARAATSVPNGDDILSPLLPEARDVFVLDVNNVQYKGALCRLVDDSEEDDKDRVAVKLLIEQTNIRVPRKAILKGTTREMFLSLGLKVMLPLVRAQCSSDASLIKVDLHNKTNFDASMAMLIDTIVTYNAHTVNVDYKSKMQEALARLPHRLKTDLFIVCGSIANAELFSQIETRANLSMQSFSAVNGS